MSGTPYFVPALANASEGLAASPRMWPGEKREVRLQRLQPWHASRWVKSGTGCASDRLLHARTIGRVTMIYREIEYQLRAGLGRKEWVILIYYPDKPDGKATVAKFRGTLEGASTDARSKIDYWMKDQKRKALPPRPPRKPGRPRGLRT